MNIRVLVAMSALSVSVAAPAEKPVVVLVGDSIRLGYAPIVAERLKDVATVVSTPENGGDSANVLKHLDEWVISKRPAVVHFNAGLHDLKTNRKTGAKQVKLDDYRKNLDEIVRRLDQETTARLVFATTTPIVDERHQARKGDFDRSEADVVTYNQAAQKILAKTSIVAIDDLHALILELGPERAVRADGTHFTPAANVVLGERVARAVRQALEGVAVTRAAVCRRARSRPKSTASSTIPSGKQPLSSTSFPRSGAMARVEPTLKHDFLWDDDALYFAGTMADREVRRGW